MFQMYILVPVWSSVCGLCNVALTPLQGIELYSCVTSPMPRQTQKTLRVVRSIAHPQESC